MLHEAVLALAVGQHGGSFSGEHGIGRINQHDYDRFTPPLIQRYSGAVAAAFGAPIGATRFGPAQ
jgi:H+/Cl- antiporter ClcA